LFNYDGKVIGSFSYGGKNYTDSNMKFVFNPSDSNYEIDLYSKFSISYFEVKFLTKMMGGNTVSNMHSVSQFYLKFGFYDELYKIVSGAGTDANPYIYESTEIPSIYNYYLANGNTLGSGISGIKGYRLRWYHKVNGTDPIYSTEINYDKRVATDYDYQQLFVSSLWNYIDDYDNGNPIEF